MEFLRHQMVRLNIALFSFVFRIIFCCCCFLSSVNIFRIIQQCWWSWWWEKYAKILFLTSNMLNRFIFYNLLICVFVSFFMKKKIYFEMLREIHKEYKTKYQTSIYKISFYFIIGRFMNFWTMHVRFYGFFFQRTRKHKHTCSKFYSIKIAELSNGSLKSRLRIAWLIVLTLL